MTWLTWRQFRVPALSVLAGVLALAVVLVITRPELVGRTDISDEDFPVVGTTLVMYLLPAILGVFWGSPLVARCET